MPNRIGPFIFSVFLVLWAFSSVVVASEEPGRLAPQSLTLSSEATLLNKSEGSVPEAATETYGFYSREEFEQAFKKHFSRPWSVMLYQGFGTSTDLGQILVLNIKSEDSLFTGLAANRKMFPFWRYFTFELEGQVIRHYRKQEHWEYNGLFIVRFHPFLLDPTVDIEFAVGEGLSYATHTPTIEVEQHPDASSRFLNYLVFEVAFTHAQYREWTLVTRIHHRSGAFRLFNGTRGGSNFLALGMRYHF